MMYIVDSNFFITSYRSLYPPDVFPGFWDKIIELAQRNTIHTIDKVKNEILPANPEKDDWLAKWFRSEFPKKAIISTADYSIEYGTVVNWAYSAPIQYLPKALDEFMDAKTADAFLVAVCLRDIPQRTLITYEKSHPNRTSKIYIPEPCNALGVRHLEPLDMFRELGTAF